MIPEILMSLSFKHKNLFVIFHRFSFIDFFFGFIDAHKNMKEYIVNRKKANLTLKIALCLDIQVFYFNPKS